MDSAVDQMRQKPRMAGHNYPRHHCCPHCRDVPASKDNVPSSQAEAACDGLFWGNQETKCRMIGEREGLEFTNRIFLDGPLNFPFIVVISA